MADTASPVRTISSGSAEGEPSMRLHRPSSARYILSQYMWLF